MSRRHHGNRPHRSSGPPGPTDPIRSGFDAPVADDPRERAIRPSPATEPSRGLTRVAADDRGVVDVADVAVADPGVAETPVAETPAAETPVAETPVAETPVADRRPVEADRVPAGPLRIAEPARRGPGSDGAAPGEMASCTAPQLRRFIKSRPYVPMHELRRRFGINGSEDDVSSIDLGDHHRVFVGLPAREGGLLGELLRGGDIGYELSLDPLTPIVIGLYPMRPVARS